MLGRAAKEYAPPAARSDLAKQLFPSSSPAQDDNIQDQFNKARQPSQSIGGYTGVTNLTNPLYAKSPNIKPNLKRKFDRETSASTSSKSSASFHSLFSKQSSFASTPATVDLTQNVPAAYKPVPAIQQHVQFDADDFEDDADLDLDMDYELPKSMAAPPKPATKRAVPSSAPPRFNNTLSRLTHSQNPSSGAMTWSSSPPSHKQTPPGAVERPQHQEVVDLRIAQDPGINNRPAKRRTLPFPQYRSEKDEIAARIEEREEESASLAASGSSPIRICFKCKGNDHYQKDCPMRTAIGTAWDFTPLPKDRKDKSMPWNGTASAVRDEKKRFKDKQKATRRMNESDMQALELHSTKLKPSMAPITLSNEQHRVSDLVVNKNKSVFFTGAAGTGKSVLMKAIIAELRKKYMKEPDRIAVTASTGLAACNIGGVTLHSFGGIGLGKEDVSILVKKIKRNPKAKNRWLKTKVLIIDEISMVEGELFDKLEGIARAMRNNGRPFGGIQLVITGDFFQLPPVGQSGRTVKFAFDATTWPTAIDHTIGLTEVFRQKDPVFANMLNEMRLGKITNDTIQAFSKLSRKIDYQDSLDATELFPTRKEVENSNGSRMRSLAGVSYKYEALDSGTITDLEMRNKLLSNMMAPQTLELKKGAQVMLIKNMDDGLVNGSLGKIIGFMNHQTFEYYDHNPDVLDDSIEDDELDDAGRAMRSSIRSTYTTDCSNVNPGKLYPLVRFSNTDGTIRELLVEPEEWKVELPSGEVQAQRSQLPLILAWALSIHKAQGQTLERVKIDLRKIFEKGQAYVALSRATTQAGLEVQNFDKSKVMAHPRVVQFYNSLYSVNQALQYPKVA